VLKAAIICHAEQQWTEVFLLVLLRICTPFKVDLQASVAELVHSEPLRIPGELLMPTVDPMEPAHLNTQPPTATETVCSGHHILFPELFNT
jgi:hypothetical protein